MTKMINRLSDRLLTRFVPGVTAAAADACGCNCFECRMWKDGKIVFGWICRDCFKGTSCGCRL
ncbi:hypothetical protein [Spongiactinospora sp. TRM90649]|uniref:hypothetical protein n=1 Tax=Spongiactinospora sp. TRM90649 TaxID=3031114 RepID=UPI0023F6AE36|nr:hypothetical protein [Spongiactinospora sp. TRM90649]MDF5757516.1 hypothetical protein [Spongiactinospora sp. TRM90649]